MALHIRETTDERLVGGEVVTLLRETVRRDGQALVLCPSLALSLEVQRELAAHPDLAMGVACETPETWATLRWALYGDGRRLVTPPQRAVIMAQLLLSAGDVAPLGTGEGTVEVLCQVAQRALPWLPVEGMRELSAGESRALELVRAYGELLAERRLVEPCEAVALLPELMAQQGRALPTCLMLGFSSLPRATRELAAALAHVAPLELVVRSDGGPASMLAVRAAHELARAAGVSDGQAAETRVACVSEGASNALDVPQAAAQPAGHVVPERDQERDQERDPERDPELDALLAALFRPSEGEGLRPRGAVRLLEPAGPLAVDEVACQHVCELADQGVRSVVVVAPKVAATWSSLAPKLRARGISVRAQVSVPAAQTRVGAGFLRFAEHVARLAELDASWPSDPEQPLPDMSWWPPRDISDFLLAGVTGAAVERAWGRDASWRGNRILTPRAVLETLMNPSATSPTLASATRELLSGHLAAAAGRLMGLGQGAGAAAAGTASTPAGTAASSKAADATVTDPNLAPQPSAEAAFAAEEDAAALRAIAEAGRALREGGVDLKDPNVTLQQLVMLARVALGRISVTCRPQLTCPDATCEVQIVSARTAASLSPRSADALVYLGLDAASAPIGTTDGALDELLSHAGIDEPDDALASARAQFAAAVRVPTRELALVRPVRDERASETFPAVMLSEVIACYATQTNDDGDEEPLLQADAGSRRDEGLVEENLAARGTREPLRSVPGAAPAGRLDDALRRFVTVPRDGQAELPEGRPTLSASQIESYLECPYKWFTLRRLGLDDCDAGFTNMEMGTFAHRVLEVTHRELFLEASRRAGLVDEDCGERPEGSLFWFDPSVRVPGSRVDTETLDHAKSLLREEFALHLAHQRLDGSNRSKQALIPHTQSEQRRLDELQRDLEATLEFEATRFEGFEPRLFEGRFGGSSGLAATYAGADLVGTIDRIDVDAEGRALVIDYKHKSSLFDEYSLAPKGEADWSGGFALPRRVQTLVYASVARELLRGTGLTVVGAVYLGTRGNHQVAGAVSARDAGAVWGAEGLREADLNRVTLPVPGARTFDDLLDRTEERIAEAIDQMRAGIIDARPVASDACNWCPVLDCERRLS